MEQTKHDQDFYLALLDFVLSARQSVVAAGNDHGLTAIQAITLLMLDGDKPRPMKEFCTLYHCDASNITGIIDGLERKGLVNRKNDPHDRRIKNIQLSAKGKVLQQKMLRQLSSDSVQLIDPLQDNEKKTLKKAFEKISATHAA